MKKVAAILICMVMVIGSLSGCKKADQKTDESNSDSTITPSQAEEKAPAPHTREKANRTSAGPMARPRPRSFAHCNGDIPTWFITEVLAPA